MFTFAKKDKRTEFEKYMDGELVRLCQQAEKPEEIRDALDLMSRWELQKKERRHLPISWDTIAIIGGNLLGIALILGYEKINVVTSKALGFVLRGRV